VNIVRRRAVIELTLSGADSDGSGTRVEHCSTVSNSDKTDGRALGNLVSQQVAEIETLRLKLAEADNTISKQSSEIAVWKRRMESNPSQLDDVINELTGKVSELELLNTNLRSQLESNDDERRVSVSCKDQEIAEVRQILEQCKLESRNVTQERDTLRQELEGLSSAYTGLEEEYNRLLSLENNEVSTGNSIQGEKLLDSQAREDETNKSSAALISLKNENSKLRADIRAANEWMSMAVKKMDELTKRNSRIDEELRSLRDSQSSHQAPGARPTGNITKLSLLEQELSIMKQKLGESQSECHELRSRMVSVESQLSESEERVNDLQSKVQTRDVSSQSLQLTVSSLEATLLQKEDYVSELEAKLHEANLLCARFDPVDGTLPFEETAKLRAEVQKLSASNNAAQDWMANAMKQHKSQTKLLEDARNENTRLRTEIDLLRSAELGREHAHQILLLESQITALTTEKFDLLGKLTAAEGLLQEKEKALINSTSSNTPESSASQEASVLSELLVNRDGEIERLQKYVAELHRRCDNEKKSSFDVIERLHSEGEGRSEEILYLQNKIQELSKGSSSLGEQSDELHFLRSNSESLRQKIDEIESNYDIEKNRLAVAQNNIEYLKKENDMLKDERKENYSTIEEMRNRLNEFQSWSETAQQRISELEAQKESADERIDALLVAEARSKAEFEAMLEELAQTKREADKETDHLINSLHSSIASHLETIAELSREKSDLMEKTVGLEKTISIMNESLQHLKDFENTAVTKQNQVTEIEAELAMAKMELDRMAAASAASENKWRGKRLKFPEMSSYVRVHLTYGI